MSPPPEESGRKGAGDAGGCGSEVVGDTRLESQGYGQSLRPGTGQGRVREIKGMKEMLEEPWVTEVMDGLGSSGSGGWMGLLGELWALK